MKKILLAVDDTKSSVRTCETLIDTLGSCIPGTLVLLYVEKLEGSSVMDDLLLSESEMQTLKESLKGTRYQELLDQKAEKILDHFAGLLEAKGIGAVKKILRQGHPAEEIMAAAKDEKVDMIVMGSRSRRLQNIFMGSVSREVANKAEIPVLLVR